MFQPLIGYFIIHIPSADHGFGVLFPLENSDHSMKLTRLEITKGDLHLKVVRQLRAFINWYLCAVLCHTARSLISCHTINLFCILFVSQCWYLDHTHIHAPHSNVLELSTRFLHKYFVLPYYSYRNGDGASKFHLNIC